MTPEMRLYQKATEGNIADTIFPHGVLTSDGSSLKTYSEIFSGLRWLINTRTPTSSI